MDMEQQLNSNMVNSNMVNSNATAYASSLRTAMAELEDTFTETGVSASEMEVKIAAIEDALNLLRDTVRYAYMTDTVVRVGPFLPTCSQCGDTVFWFYSADESICGDCGKNNEQKACYEDYS